MEINRVKLARTDEERQAIFRFRYRVYCDDGRPDRLGLDHRREMFIEDLDDTDAMQFYCGEASDMLGVFRVTLLFHTQLSASLATHLGIESFLTQWGRSSLGYGSRLMSARRCRRTHVAAQLICASYRPVRIAGTRFVVMYCRPSIVPLYEHFGFRSYAEPFMHPVSGVNVPLVLLLGDTQRLEAIGSPLAECAAEFDTDHDAIKWFESSHAKTTPCV